MTGQQTEKTNVIKEIFNKNELKRRLPYALLAGFTSSFSFFFFGVLEIFAGNRDEFLFSASDFVGYVTLIALGAAIVISALIMFLPKTASLLVFGMAVWVTFMGYVQVLFLNGSGSLGTDTGQTESLALIITDAVIWAVAGIVIIAGALIMQSKDVLKKIYLIGIVVLLVMQGSGCVSKIGDITRDRQDTKSEQTTAAVTDTGAPGTATETVTDALTDALTDAVTEKPAVKDTKSAYLTKQGLDQVSTGKNIIIFLVDRFDISYYNDLISKDKKFFDGLDGFTYFNDNVTLYSRTWPAVPTMITGIDNDFSTGAADYFMKAYTQSPFLKDLKANNYRIKIYTQKYYCYRDGTPLVEVADNISTASGYTIKDKSALVGNMLALSAYRYSPNAFKDYINISSASFSGIVELNGTAPLYEIDDPAVCGQILQNGLSFDGDGNSYIFIHLNGGHSPYNMDADANRLEEEIKDSSGVVGQLRGCFKMIYFYLDEMKRLGVYDDSTIIITGDHPRARDDKKEPTQPRLTSLFVKPAGSTGELKYSEAQVSQENFIPTLVKSAGIKTENDYGRSYFEVPEDENTVRYHKFELSGEPNQIVTFKVEGKGTDFNNWSIDSRTELDGTFYK